MFFVVVYLLGLLLCGNSRIFLLKKVNKCFFECGFESFRNLLGWLILGINCGFFLLNNKCKYKFLYFDFIFSCRICNISIF